MITTPRWPHQWRAARTTAAIVALAVLAVGCGSDDATDAETSPTTTSATPVSFEFIRYHQQFLSNFPLVQTDPAKKGLTTENLPVMLFGLFTVIFLIRYPAGLAGLVAKTR